MNIRKAFLKATIPIQRFMDRIHRPDFIVKGEFFWRVSATCRDGDILGERINWNMTNPFIRGFWKHVGIVCRIEGKWWVVESVGNPGVRKVPLPEWILSKDYVIHLRPKISIEQRREAATEAVSVIGSLYDFLFEDGVKEFYCSELIRFVYRKSLKFKTKSKKEILPIEIVESPLLEVVNDSRLFK
jgi:uncharacterized protein YycO